MVKTAFSAFSRIYLLFALCLLVDELLHPSNQNHVITALGKQNAEKIIYELEEEFAAPMKTAWSMVEDSLEGFSVGRIIPTGSSVLNELLGGGIFTGDITEVYGLFSTGKSQLCMSLSLQAVLSGMRLENETPHFSKVWYIDSFGSFSPNRIIEMFEGNLSYADQLEPQDDKLAATNQILQHIQVFDIHSAMALFNVLTQLHTLLQDSEMNVPLTNDNVSTAAVYGMVSDLRLVVVDSFGSLMAPIVGSKYGRSLLKTTSLLMKHMASKFNLAFVLTNHTTRDMQQQQSAPPSSITHKPALGKHWNTIPSVQLMMRYPVQESTLKMGGRVAEVVRSTHTLAGKSCNVTISNRGISEPLGFL